MTYKNLAVLEITASGAARDKLSKAMLDYFDNGNDGGIPGFKGSCSGLGFRI